MFDTLRRKTGYAVRRWLRGQAVRFEYDHPERGLERRFVLPDRVQPLRKNQRGGVYLTGRDLDRDAPRSFSAERIERFV